MTNPLLRWKAMTSTQRVCVVLGVVWAISVIVLSVGQHLAASAERTRAGQAGQFSHERI